jgi:hypothetical protein
MKTFPLSDAGQAPGAFEIENIYVSRRLIAAVLKGIEGVTDVQLRGSFLTSDDVRVAFLFSGHPCLVWEPFGDNSRYWIGPEDLDGREPDMSLVRAAFEGYRPPFLRDLIGYLVTGRFAG